MVHGKCGNLGNPNGAENVGVLDPSNNSTLKAPKGKNQVEEDLNGVLIAEGIGKGLTKEVPTLEKRNA
jgi:hypothetical protein